MIKVEPELCIIDDPYVSKLFLCEINSTHSSFELVEDRRTISVPEEKKKSNVNSTAKSHRKRKSRAQRGEGFISCCSVCCKSFEKLIEYELHMSQVHNIKPYECETCGRKFSRKTYLAPHMRVHSGERPYSCKHCASSFSRASDFKKHNRSHEGIKLFKCELCGKRFTRAFSLRYHLSGHTGEKNFVCEICGVRFRKSTGYNYHKKTQCKNTFECVYCKMKFQSRGQIVYHLRKRH